MARRRITPWLSLESEGIKEVLMSSQVKSAVDQINSQVASQVRGNALLDRYGVEVREDSYISNDRNGPRVAASVTLASWAGKRLEGRDGVLTQAAAALGGEVKN